MSNSVSKKYNILVVDLEPTPYKTDLWNTCFDSAMIEPTVIYTERKNWLPDGGHNYLKWPDVKFENTVLSGKGISGKISSAYHIVKIIFNQKYDLVFIAGYVHLQTIIAMLVCVLLKRRFVLHADEFNNDKPTGRLAKIKYIIRESLRKIAFKFSEAILVCGRRGKETAKIAGVVNNKICNFPYVIDKNRILSDQPEAIPAQCEDDLVHSKRIIFFSGRMIPRKGLSTLLASLKDVPGSDWVLWAEGDGPDLDFHVNESKELKLFEKCRFLGFCQYDLHSWLIRNAEIVIVPSNEDTWGIIVDEGLQLGKLVISSDATGSGYDRILDKKNGFIFPAGDAGSLANLIDKVINDPGMDEIKLLASTSEKNVTPMDNIIVLNKIILNYA